ncbi:MULTISPECIES: hypothetical protein [Streptosporangium]|uniref:Transcriptional regulator n=1 Tax=Streptosporangium brasiliense TaxID=47480 RepID=A0ABT9RKU3_9ACTN|nr:hypothetical protein [Streptosporangium brasiliense]
MKHPLRKVGALLDAKAVRSGRSARNHLPAIAQSNGIPANRVNEVLETVGLREVAKRWSSRQNMCRRTSPRTSRCLPVSTDRLMP